jgi:hypothetical protein
VSELSERLSSGKEWMEERAPRNEFTRRIPAIYHSFVTNTTYHWTKKGAKTSVHLHFFYIFPVSANLMFETDMSIVPGTWQDMMRRIRRISRLDQFRIALMLMR